MYAHSEVSWCICKQMIENEKKVSGPSRDLNSGPSEFLAILSDST